MHKSALSANMKISRSLGIHSGKLFSSLQENLSLIKVELKYAECESECWSIEVCISIFLRKKGLCRVESVTTGAKEETAHTRGCCVAPFSIFWLGQNKRTRKSVICLANKRARVAPHYVCVCLCTLRVYMYTRGLPVAAGKNSFYEAANGCCSAKDR